MKSFAPIIVRVGVSLVVLWFGMQQLLHAEIWTALLPDWTHALPISPITLIHLNGLFEVIFGTLLFFGFYIRILAFILALHLLDIAYTVGYGAIAVRDFGLALSAFSVFFYGPDMWSLDRYFDRQKVAPHINDLPHGFK
jgi:uncharacterized membrane protein YphA (DoxX/SURF4 family)